MFSFLPLEQPAGLSPALLAYVGDAVFEVYVRSVLAAEWAGKMDAMHNQAVSSVKAQAQARMLKVIEDMLDEQERDIVRRGRNSKAGHVPKNAAMMDYRYSTGFESLIGYLYLGGNENRLNQILEQLKGHILNGRENNNESGLD